MGRDMSHTMQVLNHLENKPITAMDALNDYGCFRLAARINELRMSGHNIKTEIKNQDGKRYAMYYLLKKTKGEVK
jgi:flagellar biosynthesis protein FlhB